MAHGKLGALIERINSTATSAGTLNLANNSQSFQRFTGTTTHTVVLPATNAASPNECPVGLKFVIMNRSTGTVTVNANGGGLLLAIAGGSQTTFRLSDNSTAAGAWDATVESSSGGGSATLTSLEKIGALSALAGSFYQDAQTDAVMLQINPEEIGGNFWTTKTPLSSVRRYVGSFTLGGFIYSLGGENPVSTKVTTVERYNDDSNTVLARTALTTATTQIGGFALTLGYASGGFQASQTAVVQAYDDVLDSWSAKAALPATRASYTPAVLDGYGILSGGDLSGSPTATSLIYDSVANVWYSRADRPISRRETLGFASPNKYYSIGGETAATNLGYAFSSVSNSWVSIANHPATTIQNGPATFASGTGYSMGGQGPAYSAVNYRYNVDANLWNTMSPKPTGAHSNLTSGASLNGVAYVLGGETTGVTLIASIESYTPFSFFAVPLSKKSTSAPTGIFVAAALSGVVTSVPVRIRTDGTNWKNLTANADSVLKQGETFAKFAANGSGHYNYELQIGLPTYLASVGSGQWTTIASPGTFKPANIGGVMYTFNQSNSAKYSEDLNNWAAIANTASGGGNFTSVSLQGLGYAQSYNGSNFVTSIRRYDPMTNVYATMTSPNTNHYDHLSSQLNGFMYATTGFTGSYVLAHEYFSPSTNAWTNRLNSPTGRDQCGGCSFNGFSYIVNGSNSGSPQAAVYKYNDGGNVWITLTSIPTAQFGAGVFVADGLLSALGGNVSGTLNQRYNDSSNSWNLGQAMPGGLNDNGRSDASLSGGGIASNQSGPAYKFSPSIKNVVLGAALRIS